MVFDLDGTLVDSHASIAASLDHALAAHGIEPPGKAELRALVGAPLHAALASLTGLAPASAALGAVVDDFRAHYAGTYLDSTPAYDGIVGVLDELGAAGYTLAVGTSKLHRSAVRLLEHLGIADRFAVIEGHAPSAQNETKATVVGRVLAAFDPATRFVMVGDTAFDVDGAGEHGVPTIGVTWGTSSDAELRAAGALMTVQHPAQLPLAIAACLDAH